jgi:hypothetical protein
LFEFYFKKKKKELENSEHTITHTYTGQPVGGWGGWDKKRRWERGQELVA